jgi:hypothetical protein
VKYRPISAGKIVVGSARDNCHSKGYDGDVVRIASIPTRSWSPKGSKIRDHAYELPVVGLGRRRELQCVLPAIAIVLVSGTLIMTSVVLGARWLSNASIASNPGQTPYDSRTRIAAIKGFEGEIFAAIRTRGAHRGSAESSQHLPSLRRWASPEAPGYLVVEFIDGSPIAPANSTRKVLDRAVQIADRLTAAHAVQIVHRRPSSAGSTILWMWSAERQTTQPPRSVIRSIALSPSADCRSDANRPSRFPTESRR